MQLISCPWCGPRVETEFSFGGAADNAPNEVAGAAETELKRIMLRPNVRGRQSELWQHVSGCRAWLRVERDTASHEIFEVSLTGTHRS
jgi:heterotetrameric sarcosine oxidase delta subunit